MTEATGLLLSKLLRTVVVLSVSKAIGNRDFPTDNNTSDDHESNADSNKNLSGKEKNWSLERKHNHTVVLFGSKNIKEIKSNTFGSMENPPK